MNSKALNAFKDRVDKLDDDIDLVDVLSTAIVKGDLSSADSETVLKRINPQKHVHLSRRQNSAGSRTLISNHLRNTVHASYVKTVYECFSTYLRRILVEASQSGFDIDRLVGENNLDFKARDILKSGSWDQIRKEISNTIFRRLEQERSTAKLIEKMVSKLDLSINVNLISAALPYLEVRHILVHRGGTPDQKFRDENPSMRLQNNKIDLRFEFITEFRKAISELIVGFDQAVLEKGFLEKRFCVQGGIRRGN